MDWMWLNMNKSTSRYQTLNKWVWSMVSSKLSRCLPFFQGPRNWGCCICIFTIGSTPGNLIGDIFLFCLSNISWHNSVVKPSPYLSRTLHLLLQKLFSLINSLSENLLFLNRGTLMTIWGEIENALKQIEQRMKYHILGRFWKKSVFLVAKHSCFCHLLFLSLWI